MDCGGRGRRGRRGRLHHTGRSGLYHTGRGKLDRIQDWADWADLADWADEADSIILDGADWEEYMTGRTRADRVDWWIGGRSGLRNPGRSGLRNPRRGELGRTGVDGTNYGILEGVDWGGRGGLADRLGCAHPGRLASSHLRADGIPEVLSPDADCGVIWLHTPGIHIRFFRAHVVVIFLGTHTSKAQRASTDDKFFGSLGALNITYSMFIQMGHAIRDVVFVTYKGGLSSLVPPSPLCTSCCS